MAKSQIPRRTSRIELWDFNPVANAASWRREMLQFWSLMALKGRRAGLPEYMTVPLPDTKKRRHLGTGELARILTDRLLAASSGAVDPAHVAEIHRWFLEAIVVPGEGKKGEHGPPAAGVNVPHFGALAVLNRGSGAQRERYWAAFYFNALESDLEARDYLTGVDLAGDLVWRFGLAGADLQVPGDLPNGWRLDLDSLVKSDPSGYLTLVALGQQGDDVLPTVTHGLPPSYFSGLKPSPRGSYETFLCPGTVVQMRRATKLLLGSSALSGAPRASRPVLSDLLEAIFANHGAIYFVRGMRVLNDLTEQRRLPDDCAKCWKRFQDDVKPKDEPARKDRLRGGATYNGAATDDDIDFIERTCTAKEVAFVNAGRKELGAAKDLARMSLEDLRRRLTVYTVNRIMLAIANDVAEDLRKDQGLQSELPLVDTYLLLDEWQEAPHLRGALGVKWVATVKALAEDAAVPEHVPGEVVSRIAEAKLDPRRLEEVARWIVAETILSSRQFGRYIELLHSLLGGGALPSNQDPKGLLARGGSRAFPFHFSLRERSLEALVAIASIEAEESGDPLSFQGFLDFLADRYGLLVDRAPTRLPEGSAGLVAEATTQSREALRSRLIDMGLLKEFSDSSEWNRISWTGQP